MPPVCIGRIQRSHLWFRGYEQTYLECDVHDLGRVGDLISFRQLLHLVALRTGQLLNISELARDAKMNTATTSRYLSLLEASFYEVDFIIETGCACLAVEVKAAARWNERDLAGLPTFLQKTPHCRAAILAYGATDTVPLEERL